VALAKKFQAAPRHVHDARVLRDLRMRCRLSIGMREVGEKPIEILETQSPRRDVLD